MSHNQEPKGAYRYLGTPNSQAKHKECSLINFRLVTASSYFTLAFPGVQPLLIFSSTWEIRAGIFNYDEQQIKKSKSGPGHDSVSKFIPCTDQLMESKKQNLIKFSCDLLLLV